MAEKLIKETKLDYFTSSYLASACTMLKKAGYWQGDDFQLTGLTGFAFRFIIHKHFCPSSFTMYDWPSVLFSAMDRIGVYTEIFHLLKKNRYNTMKIISEKLNQKIKQSIDRDIPVILWAPTEILEFGLITGYDDEDQVFFTEDCTFKETDPLLYDDMGNSEIPILFFQFAQEKVQYDPLYTTRLVLNEGLRHWDSNHSIHYLYATGKKAYDFALESLRKDDYYPFGLSFLIFSYAGMKDHLYQFINHISDEYSEFEDLKEEMENLNKLKNNFQKMNSLFPFKMNIKKKPDKIIIEEIQSLFKESYQLEDQFYRRLSLILKEA